MKRPGLRASINAFCRSCIYDPIGGTGTWRQQVEDCTSPTCPLYAVRPVSTTGDVDHGKAENAAEDERSEPRPEQAA